MNESDFKRFLIRSIRAQGGVGHRFEDRYAVGWPDLLFIPEQGPVFFCEAKILQGAKLVCTEMQKVQLARLHRNRRKGQYFCHGVVIGYSEKRGAVYIGQPGQQLINCPLIPRPSKLNSADWEITHLLLKAHDRRVDNPTLFDVVEDAT